MRITSKTSRQEFWQRALVRQRKSGLSIRRFCEQEGLAVATFYIWKRRLDQGTTAMPVPVDFAPVQVQPEMAPTALTGDIEIFLPHDRRVRLIGKVDRQQLAEVLAALG